jgi:hypothetical protein
MRRFRNVTGAVPKRRAFSLQPGATLPCFEFKACCEGESKPYPLQERREAELNN